MKLWIQSRRTWMPFRPGCYKSKVEVLLVGENYMCASGGGGVVDATLFVEFQFINRFSLCWLCLLEVCAL